VVIGAADAAQFAPAREDLGERVAHRLKAAVHVPLHTEAV
jgi:hypothetical protein